MNKHQKVLRDSTEVITKLIRSQRKQFKLATGRGHQLGLGVGRPRRGTLAEKALWERERELYYQSKGGA